MQVNADSIEQLEKLGLTACAEAIKAESARREKLVIAYKHYRYVSNEKREAFEAKLRKETRVDEGKNQWGERYRYKCTKMTPLQEYRAVPPAEILEKLEAAQGLGCFDEFQVMTLETHRVMPDPVLFGLVNDCTDWFVIGQWDEDIRIEEILNDHEGWKFLDKKVE